MNHIINHSDSVLSSLCREIEQINLRSDSINNSLIHCKNDLLSNRLKNELSQLKIRISAIKKVTNSIQLSLEKETLSINLLKVMISRSIVKV